MKWPWVQSLGLSLGIEESPPALWILSTEHHQIPGQQLLCNSHQPFWSLTVASLPHHAGDRLAVATGPSVVLAVTDSGECLQSWFNPRRGESPQELQGTQAISAQLCLNCQISEVRRGESHPFYLSAPRTGKGCKQNMLWEEGCEWRAGMEGSTPGFCCWNLSTSCTLMVPKHCVNGIKRIFLSVWIIRCSLWEYVWHLESPEFYYETKPLTLLKMTVGIRRTEQIRNQRCFMKNDSGSLVLNQLAKGKEMKPATLPPPPTWVLYVCQLHCNTHGSCRSPTSFVA